MHFSLNVWWKIFLLPFFHSNCHCQIPQQKSIVILILAKKELGAHQSAWVKNSTSAALRQSTAKCKNTCNGPYPIAVRGRTGKMESRMWRTIRAESCARGVGYTTVEHRNPKSKNVVGEWELTLGDLLSEAQMAISKCIRRASDQINWMHSITFKTSHLCVAFWSCAWVNVWLNFY